MAGVGVDLPALMFEACGSGVGESSAKRRQLRRWSKSKLILCYGSWKLYKAINKLEKASPRFLVGEKEGWLIADLKLVDNR
ncbi:hypothetical protein SAMN05444162_2804 [Paenibacillaceae bacterium GAS479]|nr:hypothetical protein SAMN05444162_2804 [Paenibacillaceae bacterium GAS479]